MERVPIYGVVENLDALCQVALRSGTDFNRCVGWDRERLEMYSYDDTNKSLLAMKLPVNPHMLDLLPGFSSMMDIRGGTIGYLAPSLEIRDNPHKRLMVLYKSEMAYLEKKVAEYAIDPNARLWMYKNAIRHISRGRITCKILKPVESMAFDKLEIYENGARLVLSGQAQYIVRFRFLKYYRENPNKENESAYITHVWGKHPVDSNSENL